MPVGGQSSFYTDWYSPSNTNGQKTTYKWETFLTKELPDFLEDYGVSRTNNARRRPVDGWQRRAALAAYHRDQFKFAGSLSGYLNISAPGMREAIRVAMLDAGRYNVDSMWGPPWSTAWLRKDPFVFAPQLKGLPMYISAGTGIPGQYDQPNSLDRRVQHDDRDGARGAVHGEHSRAFQFRLATLQIPARFDFPLTGTHGWKYWEGELWKSRPQILDALNAH